MTGAVPDRRQDQRAPSFEEMLRDPNEQFDLRSELLASIDEYMKAPPATFTAPPAVSQVPGQQREAVVEALRRHHPIMRSEDGPISGCRCGQVRLGQDVIAHVTDALLAATRDGEQA